MLESYRQRGAMMTEEHTGSSRRNSSWVRQQQLMPKGNNNECQELDDDEDDQPGALQARISVYLKEFNKAKNLQFILGYQKGGRLSCVAKGHCLDINQAGHRGN
jgi:hypothetical protein